MAIFQFQSIISSPIMLHSRGCHIGNTDDRRARLYDTACAIYFFTWLDMCLTSCIRIRVLIYVNNVAVYALIRPLRGEDCASSRIIQPRGCYSPASLSFITSAEITRFPEPPSSFARQKFHPHVPSPVVIRHHRSMRRTRLL